MNTIYKYSILGLLPFCAITTKASNTESTDSVKTTQLEEIVVKGENQWIENGKAVFIPTRQAKRLAKDMESMIRIMNAPMLIVKDKKVTTTSGESVAFYINGVPVDNVDRETFWANNVLRVEFYPNPDDTKFRGQRNVLNIIMKEYIAGGLTKLNGDQTFPNDGTYRLSSKFVYKKMTYNATVKAGYSRDHLSHYDAIETFNDVWYNGNFYNLITREDEARSVSRSNDFSSAFNARYRSEKFIATHGISFGWNQNPNSNDVGNVTYSPSIISSGHSLSNFQSRQSAVDVNGDYAMKFSPKWILWANWSTGYSHFNHQTSYNEFGESPIDNYARENAWKVKLNVRSNIQLTQKIILGFSIQNNYEHHKTFYDGSVSSIQNMSLNNTTFAAQSIFNLSPKIRFNISPQLAIYHRGINSIYNQTDLLPGISGNFQINTHAKSMLSAQVFYSISSPGASDCNDLIIRQTELKWIEGNPELKTSNYLSGDLSFSWMPLSWLGFNANVNASMDSNRSYIAYRSGGTEYDGIIGSYINGKTINTIGSFSGFIFKLFNGSVQLRTDVDYQFHRLLNGHHISRVRPQISADWYVSDFSIDIATYGPEKYPINGGTGVGKSGWQYWMGVSYGNGRLICGLTLNNIFSKYRFSQTYSSNGPYHDQRLQWDRGRHVSINVTYYFDYGKKVSPNIDIQSISNIDSSILSSN